MINGIPLRQNLVIGFYILSLLFNITLSQNLKTGVDNDQLIKPDTLLYETDEVVVTGTRTTKKIIDIPYSVMRLNTANYKYDRRNFINNVLPIVPGVFLQSRYGNHDVRISIRGFGTRSNSGIRGIRILMDGIPESEPDGQTRIEAVDFNAIGSTEIVKGNSSSIYTNAPGGVVNFIGDINFNKSFLTSFNDFSSYNLRRNGLKLGIRTKDYGFLATYTYHNYNGYREHSADYWHIFNTILETTPCKNTSFQILGYYVNGIICLPGSLTKEEFDENPFQAVLREKSLDFKRISKKGRVGLRIKSVFGSSNNNEIEVTTYGTIKYFERAQNTYRIINRYGFGASLRYVNNTLIFNQENEFSVGGDFFYQTGPIEEYINDNGTKGNELILLTDETMGNAGFYIINSFELYNRNLYLLLSGRYDDIYFKVTNQRNDLQQYTRSFYAFTPKAALNYKFNPNLAAYISYGLSFDSPAGNELDNYSISSDSGISLLNPDLKPQKSKNFEIGFKGNLVNYDMTWMQNFLFELTYFNYIIEDEIIPFELFGDVFFRNSAKTIRNGIEIGTKAEIIKGLKLSAAYTFSDFIYNNYSAASIDVDSLANIIVTEKDFSGNYVPSVPQNNLNVYFEYEYLISFSLTGHLKASYQYISGMFVNDANEYKTNDYSLLGLSIGAEVRFDNLYFIFSGGINNILDQNYVGFININSSRKRFYELGEPRIFFANLNISYTFN